MKKYNYINALCAAEAGPIFFSAAAKRILRKLVREAVMEASKEITFFPRDATLVAARIAKDLVP